MEDEYANIALKMRSETDCYNPDEQIPTCYEWFVFFNKTDTLIIDNCCRIAVKWDENICLSTGAKTIVIENFEYEILDGECLLQIQFWEYLEANGKTDELADALDAFEYEASLILEKKRIEHYGNSWGIPICGTTPFLVFADFFSNICFQYVPGPSVGPSPDFTNIVKMPCGQVCCRRSAQYCMDNGALIRIDLGFELIGDDCAEEPLDPRIGKVVWGTCDHDCVPN